MTDRHTSSSDNEQRTRRRISFDVERKKDPEDVSADLESYIRLAFIHPEFLNYFSEIVAPAVTQHYVPSSFVSQLRYDSTPLRNMLAHRSTPLSDGLAHDQLRLWDDQHELSEDFVIAVLGVLAEKRPDIFLKIARELVERERDYPRKSRTYRLLLEVLSNRGIYSKLKLRADEMTRSQRTLEGGGNFDPPTRSR